MRWEDNINDNPPKELPLHLVRKTALKEEIKVPPKVIEEVKEFDLKREVIINFAMNLTKICDHEIIAEALLRVFGGEIPSKKTVHIDAQKIFDAAEQIENEKCAALFEKSKKESEFPEYLEETKQTKNKNYEMFNDFGEYKIPAKKQSNGSFKFKGKKNSKNKNTSHERYILSAIGEKIIAPEPNKKCHCGSGNKYKKCCMQADNERVAMAEEAEAIQVESEEYPELSNNLTALYL